MPSLGLLSIAAYLPDAWEVRFVDENGGAANEADWRWADAVFTTGMHVQRRMIADIVARAHAHDKIVVLGGPSVSAAPHYYPEPDIIHIGELGDATDAVIASVDHSVKRPERQVVLRTEERTPLERFPEPAYHLLDLSTYFVSCLQYTSGCPYRCEFCDIPALYGKRPRAKTVHQVLRELDGIVAAGARGGVYFVDDNFVANPKATRALLPHLVRWQEQNGFPLRFSCEATLNLAAMPDIMELMRAALFTTVYVGVETPEAEALRAMQKQQNLRVPVLEAVDTLNAHGLEVLSGIIMGLDTDTESTPHAIREFIRLSNVPLLTINLVYALPQTPLYERLERDGRIRPASDTPAPSNVTFLLPEEAVVRGWFETVAYAYDPVNLLDRFRHQSTHCYPNRRTDIQRRVSADLAWYGARAIARVLWYCGVRASWRRDFWKLARELIAKGQIEDLVEVGVLSYHLIAFARQIQQGDWEAAFYADPSRTVASKGATKAA